MDNLGANFYPKLVQISSELGMNPEDILTIMISESGLNPAIPNQAGASAIGLIQFTPGTLKGLGFNKNWREFGNVSAVDQLDYVKKYIKSQEGLNGGPFKSAAQFYTATFWPVALKLPGVRQENINTAIVEENPLTIDINGRKYSKKYHDIGFKINPMQESRAYKENKLFHGTTPGAITYGDMVNQVNKIKRNPIYSKAISTMHNTTGYAPNEKMPSQQIAKKDHKNIMNNYLSPNKTIDQTLNNYLQIIFASDKSYKKLYKTLLPSHNILIEIQAEDNNSAIEFARILCTALNVELMADAYTHTDNNNVEVECKINGPEKDCFNTVVQLSDALSQTFKEATKKIGGLNIKTKCIMNKQSSYQQITIKSADINYRKFLLKFI